MRHRGLLTGIILGVFVLTGFAQAQGVSVFSRKQPKIERKYGLQLTGGYGMYSMTDINEYRASDNHTAVGNANEATAGVAWGIAILYRSNENFRWTIGYSAMGQDRTEAAWVNADNTTGLNEQSVSGGEFYVMGSYMLRFSEALHLHLGMGPTIVSGTMDRYSTAQQSVYAAKGRAIGLRFAGGVELLLGKHLGLNLAGGYRMAAVDQLRYEDRDQVEQILYYSSGSNRTMKLDFSGAFVEAGLRIYFQPQIGWFKM